MLHSARVGGAGVSERAGGRGCEERVAHGRRSTKRGGKSSVNTRMVTESETCSTYEIQVLALERDKRDPAQLLARRDGRISGQACERYYARYRRIATKH